MISEVDICGVSFEDLPEKELMLFDGGLAAEASLTFASSIPCGVISAGVTVLATVTVLMTADKI